MNKAHFPIFKNNPRLVYLDSAASAQKPYEVIEAETKFYEEYYSNVHRGIYKLSELSSNAYEEARNKVARFINAEPKEVIFTSGTTDGMNSLASSLAYNLKEGDTIITTVEEHHSSFLPFQRIANDKRLNLEYVDIKEDFTLDLDHYDTLLNKENVKFVVVSAVSNVTGFISPIKQLAQKAHEKGAQIIVDAAQMVSHMETNVKDLDVDFLVFSGHKLYGPTGIGVLYGKKELLEKLAPFKVGGGMIKEVKKDNSTWDELPAKHEAGTPNISGAIGLGAAVDYITNIGMDNVEHREKQLTEYAIEKLKTISNIRIFTPKDKDARIAVISFFLDIAHPHDIADILDRHKVAIRAGHHCAQIFMRDYLKVPATARVSIGIYNDESDIDKLIEALQEVVRIFK